MNLSDVKTHLDQQIGVRSHLKSELADKEESLIRWKDRYEASLKARIILQEAAQITQAKLEQRFSNIITLALKSISFDSAYEFLLEFVQKRNKTEADIWFVKNGEKLKPLKCSGGGACDIASLAAQIAFWSLGNTRPTMILDEPLRNLSAGFHGEASEMLKMLAEKLNLQIVMVSHNAGIIKDADNLIELGVK